MTHIFVVAHSPLASALCNCIKHIYGTLPEHIHAFDVLSDQDPGQTEKLLREAIQKEIEAKNEVLIFTDIFGATPANIAIKSVGSMNILILAGVNLPMLIKGACFRQLSANELVKTAFHGAIQNISILNAPKNMNKIND